MTHTNPRFELFVENREIYGTLGCLQKHFIAENVPEEAGLWLLVYNQPNIRQLELMTDQDVFDYVDGFPCLGTRP